MMMITFRKYNKNSPVLEQISTISGEELQRVKKSSAVVLRPFSQVGNIFTICSSTGKLLLDLLALITWGGREGRREGGRGRRQPYSILINWMKQSVS